MNAMENRKYSFDSQIIEVDVFKGGTAISAVPERISVIFIGLPPPIQPIYLICIMFRMLILFKYSRLDSEALKPQCVRISFNNLLSITDIFVDVDVGMWVKYFSPLGKRLR